MLFSEKYVLTDIYCKPEHLENAETVKQSAPVSHHLWGSVQFSFLIQKNSTIYLVQQQGSCLQLVNMECSDRTSLAFLMTCWVSFEALCGAGKPRVNRALIIKSHVLSTSLALRFWDAHVSDGHMLYRGWAWMNIEHNVWSQTLYKTSQPLNDTLHLRMALHGIPFLCFAHRAKTAWMKKLWEGPWFVAVLQMFYFWVSDFTRHCLQLTLSSLSRWSLVFLFLGISLNRNPRLCTNLKKPSHPLDPASRLQSSFQAQSVQVRMSGPEVCFGSDAFWHSWETTWSPAGYLGAT